LIDDLKYWYLKDHQLFRNLSISEIKQLCIITKFKKSSKNEIVLLDETEKPRIYFLKKGIIKLVHTNKDGEESVKEILHQGDLFGEIEFAEAHSGVEEHIQVLSHEAFICTFYKEDLEKVMREKPDFALSYIKFIGLRLKKMKNNYNNIFFKDAKTRFYLLLKSMLESEDAAESNTYSLPNYLTQKDMAQLICATRQTVIQLINQMEKEGVISYTQKSIVINDKNAILEFCENVK
jgi:CRP/FNR family transcriptional regulator, cyclic AMP receptor protein